MNFYFLNVFLVETGCNARMWHRLQTNGTSVEWRKAVLLENGAGKAGFLCDGFVVLGFLTCAP